jgi:hypothetical protein
MQFQLPCDCGASVTVSEGEAGTRTICKCGRTVAVPSLGQLRRQAGVRVAGPSPELALEALLVAGKLPEEDECVLCSRPTTGCTTCVVVFERAVVSEGGTPWWATTLAFLVFGWLGLLLARGSRRSPQVWGKDREFTLPLRTCDRCRPGLVETEAVRRALRSVPIYRRMLDKYPGARISPPVMPRPPN